MRQRPWPIVILAFLHLVAPVSNLIFGYLLSDRGLEEFAYAVFTPSQIPNLVMQFVLIPLAGLAIYSTKKIGYYIFVVLMAALIGFHVWDYQTSHTLNIWFIVFIVIVNVLVVSYFLLPQISRIYHNSGLRWWEQKPRYAVDLGVKFLIGSTEYPTQLLDMSETGAKIDPLNTIHGDVTKLTLRVTTQRFNFDVPAEVVHRYQNKWGLRFLHTEESKANTKKFIKALIEYGAQIRTPVPPWFESLKEWFLTLLKTGKGLIP
jgi:hypothetical protein